MPNLTNLATTGALTAIENKIPSISSLVKKTDYNIKINEIEKKSTDHNHDKYVYKRHFGFKIKMSKRSDQNWYG